MTTAFEITEDDIAIVIRSNWERFSCRDGESVEEAAEGIMHDLTEGDFSRIERAALDSGSDLDEQTAGAYQELSEVLVELGWLKLLSRETSPSPR